MSLFLAIAMQAAPLPLPQKTDIPDDFSTVICPRLDAARTMLEHYYRVESPPRNHTIDITHFFAGLKATGCTQDVKQQGAIIINRVYARKTLTLAQGRETYTIYSGRDARGQAFTGIVDETGNNKHPRTPFERWKAEWTQGGAIVINNPAEMDPVYICASPDAARNAVRAIPLKGGEKLKRTAFARGLAAGRCTKSGAARYVVTAKHEERNIDCGFECNDNYTALTATRNGRVVGVIFDASHF